MKNIRRISVINHPELAEALSELFGVPAESVVSVESLSVKDIPTLAVLPLDGAWPAAVGRSLDAVRSLFRNGAREVAVFVGGELRFIKPWELPFLRWLGFWDDLAATDVLLFRLLAVFLALPLRMFLDFFQILRWPEQLGPIIAIGHPAGDLHHVWYCAVARLKRRGSLSFVYPEGRGFMLGSPYWCGAVYAILGALGVRRYAILSLIAASLAWFAAAHESPGLFLLVLAPLWGFVWIRFKSSTVGWLAVLLGLWTSAPLILLIAAAAFSNIAPFMLGIPLVLLKRALIDGEPVIPEAAVSLFIAAVFLFWQRRMERGSTRYGKVGHLHRRFSEYTRANSRPSGMYPAEATLVCATAVLGLSLWLSDVEPLWIALLAWPTLVLVLQLRFSGICDTAELYMLFLGAATTFLLHSSPTAQATILLLFFVSSQGRWGFLPWGFWDLRRRLRRDLQTLPRGLRIVTESWVYPGMPQRLARVPYPFQRSYNWPLDAVWNSEGHASQGMLEPSHDGILHLAAFTAGSSEKQFTQAMSFFRPDVVVAFTPEFAQRLKAAGGRSGGVVDPDLHGYFRKSGTGRAGVPGLAEIVFFDTPAPFIEPDVAYRIEQDRIRFEASGAGLYRIRMNAAVTWEARQGNSILETYADGGDIMVRAIERGTVEMSHRFGRLFHRDGLRGANGELIAPPDFDSAP